MHLPGASGLRVGFVAPADRSRAYDDLSGRALLHPRWVSHLFYDLGFIQVHPAIGRPVEIDKTCRSRIPLSARGPADAQKSARASAARFMDDVFRNAARRPKNPDNALHRFPSPSTAWPPAPGVSASSAESSTSTADPGATSNATPCGLPAGWKVTRRDRAATPAPRRPGQGDSQDRRQKASWPAPVCVPPPAPPRQTSSCRSA